MHQASATRERTHLTFIGGGVMACAIPDALWESAKPMAINQGQKSGYAVSITVRRQESVRQLSERYPGAYVTDDNNDKKLWHFSEGQEQAAHVILICTQPQTIFEVCESIRRTHDKVPSSRRSLPTVVTMSPGISISNLESWLGPHNSSKRFAVIRTMLKTPVSIRQGATALVASRHATAPEVERVIALFRVFSPCVETLSEEDLLDVAAAVSG